MSVFVRCLSSKLRCLQRPQRQSNLGLLILGEKTKHCMHNMHYNSTCSLADIPVSQNIPPTQLNVVLHDLNNMVSHKSELHAAYTRKHRGFDEVGTILSLETMKDWMQHEHCRASSQTLCYIIVCTYCMCLNMSMDTCTVPGSSVGSGKAGALQHSLLGQKNSLDFFFFLNMAFFSPPPTINLIRLMRLWKKVESMWCEDQSRIFFVGRWITSLSPSGRKAFQIHSSK